MAKKIWGLAVFLMFLLTGAASAGTDVDFDIVKDFDFNTIKSLYIWPTTIESLPENVSLSMRRQIDDWIQDALQSKKVKGTFALKSTHNVWQHVQLLHGATEFKEPFESELSTRYFYDHLTGACTAVLKIKVSLTSERKWREPYTETYRTTEKVHSRERRRNRDGQYEYVDVEIDMPVTRERVVPGYWYTTAASRCSLELYETKRMDSYVAAANVTGNDTTESDNSRKMLTNLMQKTVTDAVAAIFYKSKK